MARRSDRIGLNFINAGLFFFLSLCLAAPSPTRAFDIKVKWDKVTQNTGNQPVTVAQYRVHFGARSRGTAIHPSEGSFQYDKTLNVSNATEIALPGLDSTQKYFLAVCAIDANGISSNYSDEYSATPAGASPSVTPGSNPGNTPDAAPAGETDPIHPPASDPTGANQASPSASGASEEVYNGVVGCASASGSSLWWLLPLLPVLGRAHRKHENGDSL